MNDINYEELNNELLAIIKKHELSKQGLIYAIMALFSKNKIVQKKDIINFLLEN